LALLASACGGGGDTSSAPAAAAGSTTESGAGPEGGGSKAGTDGGGSKATDGGSSKAGTEGGESKSKPGGGSSHSDPNAALIQQGEAICANAKEEQARGVAEFSAKHKPASSGPAAVEELTVKVGLPPIEAAIAKLKDLQPPEAAAAEFDAIVSGLEKALAEAEADPAVILTDPHSPFDEPDRLATEFGLEACAGMA
jgi:hypothetical protein